MQGSLHHGAHPGARVSPSAAAARFVGAPYRPHGEDPVDGWDCLGLVRYLRREIFGLETPSYRGLYSAADAVSPDNVERLLRSNMAAWRPVAPRPGAVVLFHWFGRDAHVGLILSASDFIHTHAGQDTTILRHTAEPWARRVRGTYDTLD